MTKKVMGANKKRKSRGQEERKRRRREERENSPKKRGGRATRRRKVEKEGRKMQEKGDHHLFSLPLKTRKTIPLLLLLAAMLLRMLLPRLSRKFTSDVIIRHDLTQFILSQI